MVGHLINLSELADLIKMLSRNNVTGFQSADYKITLIPLGEPLPVDTNKMTSMNEEDYQ